MLTLPYAGLVVYQTKTSLRNTPHRGVFANLFLLDSFLVVLSIQETNANTNMSISYMSECLFCLSLFFFSFMVTMCKSNKIYSFLRCSYLFFQQKVRFYHASSKLKVNERLYITTLYLNNQINQGNEQECLAQQGEFHHTLATSILPAVR